MLKCSRCRHIFPAPPTQRDEEEPAAESAPPGDEARDLAFGDFADGDGRDDALSLSFTEPEWEELQAELPLDTNDEPFSLGTIEEEPPRTAPPVEPPAEEPVDEPEDPEEPPDLPPPEAAEDHDASTPGRTSLSAFFVLVLVVVGLYAVAGTAVVENLALANRLVERLPFVGPALRADDHLRRQILLAELRGSFEALATGQEVFVVRGRAYNGASESIRHAEIEVRLFDTEGRQVARHSAPWGGAISSRIIGEIDRRALDTLRRAKPSDDFSVVPGESAPFTVVFLRPPAFAREYAATVVRAEAADG